MAERIMKYPSERDIKFAFFWAFRIPIIVVGPEKCLNSTEVKGEVSSVETEGSQCGLQD